MPNFKIMISVLHESELKSLLKWFHLTRRSRHGNDSALGCIS
jgi:hypothetical protein